MIFSVRSKAVRLSRSQLSSLKLLFRILRINSVQVLYYLVLPLGFTYAGLDYLEVLIMIIDKLRFFVLLVVRRWMVRSWGPFIRFS